jgi:hypothetical protein
MGTTYAQDSFVTFSAHVAVPQRVLDEYSKEGPGITGRLNYSLAPRWMAVAMVGIEEFRPKTYATSGVSSDAIKKDAKAFPLQGGIRFNINKNGNRQLYVSALSGIQLIRLKDNNPVILYRGRYHHFNIASEIGYKLGRVDFNAYFNWGALSTARIDSKYFTLGMGVNLFRPGE